MEEKKQQIRDSVLIFTSEMDRKLRRDDDKKFAWETEMSFYLLDRLHDEVDELDEAFRIYQSTSNDPDGKALMTECADVANFAMMIFSQLHPLTMHNRRGIPEHRLPRP